MITFVLKLFIAHVLGDFVLQPNSWVADKKERSFRSKYFYLHGLVHLILLLVLLGFNATYWLGILGIVFSHLLIDLFKIKMEGKKDSRLLFLFDQFCHMLVIAAVVYFYHPYTLDLSVLLSAQTLLLFLCLLLVTSASSILMKVIMGKWKFPEDRSEDSLQNAGKYIGILERLFVFAFILLNQWSAIGFLIAAKSVFRFGDLSRAKDRKLTEYILIGTLMSFGLGILVGLFYQEILSRLNQ